MKKELHDYNFNSIRVVQLPAEMQVPEVDDGMSGTKMRPLVKDNDPEGFKKDAVTLKAQPMLKKCLKNYKA